MIQLFFFLTYLLVWTKNNDYFDNIQIIKTLKGPNPVYQEPPAYFTSSYFCKESFEKGESVFLIRLFITIFNFSNLENFLIFCLKNLINRAEKTFLVNITIWYAFYSQFATFSDFEKTQVIFAKNPFVFSKNPKFWTFWEFCYNLVKKNFMVWNVNELRCIVNAIGKYWAKKTSDMTHLSGWFCFHNI